MGSLWYSSYVVLHKRRLLFCSHLTGSSPGVEFGRLSFLTRNRLGGRPPLRVTGQIFPFSERVRKHKMLQFQKFTFLTIMVMVNINAMLEVSVKFISTISICYFVYI